MPRIFVIADNVVSPLGLTTADNFNELIRNVTGIQEHTDINMSESPFYAALFNKGAVFINDANPGYYTKFEQLLIASLYDALKNTGIDPHDKKTVFILSSTKGNISLLETADDPALRKRATLHESAKLVAEYFGFINKPLVVSNACISGSLAILTGMRLLHSGQYENAVIAGADTITKFVLSGFQAFQAISNEPCKPFDRGRTGISLGEGAGTLVLSAHKKHEGKIQVSGGAVSNDANHISGPSRTGQELALVIDAALRQSNVSAAGIDFISAHGTATLYNDEMEANAFTLEGLQTVPVNSLKGYFGHTLGASGLIESIISIHSLLENIVLPTRGFEQPGVSKPLNICSTLLRAPLRRCLKTASGFGGCNAAVIFSKPEGSLN